MSEVDRYRGGPTRTQLLEPDRPSAADFTRGVRTHRIRLVALGVSIGATMAALAVEMMVFKAYRGNPRAQLEVMQFMQWTLGVGITVHLVIALVGLRVASRRHGALGMLMGLALALAGGTAVVAVNRNEEAVILILVAWSAVAIGTLFAPWGRRRAVDAGRLDDALRWWGAPWAEVAVERGDPAAAARIATGIARGPWIPFWLALRARVELETDAVAAAATATDALAREPGSREASVALALADLAGGRVTADTLSLVELGLREALGLSATLFRPHDRALRETERAWALAALGRADQAREALDASSIPGPALAAAEVRWRRGHARLALGEPEAAREEWTRGADAPGWAARRCRAELSRTASPS